MTHSEQTACRCEVAGYCKRHGAIKSLREVGLCQSNPSLYAAWEDMAITRGLLSAQGKTVEDLRKEQGRVSWSILHSMLDPSQQKIDEWFKTIPAWGCQCKKDAMRYMEINPPPHGVSREEFLYWSWEFHDAVDVKTGDEHVTWEAAKEEWMQQD